VGRSYFFSEPGLYVAGAAALGLAGGWVFHHVWRALLPRARSREFWTSVPVSARGMLMSEETSDLLRHYRDLIAAVFRYTGRNTLAVLAAALPIVASALLLAAVDPSSRLASRIEVRPAVTVAQGARSIVTGRQDPERVVIDRSMLRGSSLRLAGHTLDSAALAHKQALCTSTVSCSLLEMMLFRTHSIDAPTRTRLPAAVVVRPLLLDANPLWPWFNDIDFSFLVALTAGGVAAAWWGRRKESRS